MHNKIKQKIFFQNMLALSQKNCVVPGNKQNQNKNIMPNSEPLNQLIVLVLAEVLQENVDHGARTSTVTTDILSTSC